MFTRIECEEKSNLSAQAEARQLGSRGFAKLERKKTVKDKKMLSDQNAEENIIALVDMMYFNQIRKNKISTIGTDLWYFQSGRCKTVVTAQSLHQTNLSTKH